MKDITIIIATHKKYKMPTDSMYLPIHVGAEGKEKLGYIPDNIGTNISMKNKSFCELTGLYWAWKNLKSDYIGLVHYRRLFKSKYSCDLILTKKEASDILEKTDIILTKKRNYYIENVYNHYAHTLFVEPLDKTREIIERKYPKYINSFDKCMKRTYMHAFNMFIMKTDKLNEYCTWLFDILFELEKEMTNVEYNEFHARFPGRISELLLDVWIEQNGYDYKEIPFIYTEKINYRKKVTGFFKAKFLGVKYDKSF